MSEFEPKISHYTPETQRIVNSLPMWTKARRDRTSKAQSYLNPAGIHIEALVEKFEQHLRDGFLELANPDEPDQIRKIELPWEIPLEQPSEVNNELKNASFEIITSHDRLPDYWRAEGTGSVSVSSGFLGRKGLQLSVGSGQWAAAYQEIDEPIKPGVPWVFFLWYESSATGLTVPATGFGIEAVGYDWSAGTEVLRAAFTADTSGHPKQAVIRGSFSKDVQKVKFRVIVTNSGAFPITTPVKVDVALALEGSVLPEWRPNVFDSYPYFARFQDSLAPVVSEHGTRSQHTYSFDDFWLKAVPTRAGSPTLLSSGGTLDPDPSAGADGFTKHTEAGGFTEVDFWKKEWPVVWQLGYDGSNPRIRGYGVNAPDVFGPFELVFRNWRNWFEDGVSWTPETMTAWHGHLYVVLKKQDYAGTTKRYLGIVDPRMPWPQPYMEVLALVELPGISAKITRAEIRYSDQQHLYVGNGQSEWVYRLYYDYFMVDPDLHRLHFREDYGDVVPQLAVKAGVGGDR